MLKKIKYEFKENIRYLYISLVISFLTMLPQFIMSPTMYHGMVMILLVVLLILLSKVSKIIFLAFILYINLVNIFQSNIAIHWGKYTGNLSPRIDVAAQSPLYEAWEYLHSYVDYRDYVMILYTFSVIFIAFKFIISHKHTFKIIKLLSLVLVMPLMFLLYYQEPLSIVSKYYNTPQRYKIISERKFFLHKTNFEKKINKSLNIYDKIIIIQGEAVNKHHMGIYGYDINTTPFLNMLMKDDKLYKFNAISPSNQTRYSIPMIYTKSHVSDFYNTFIHSKSILTDFKQYGYKTYWISNQGKKGKYNDYIANVAFEADVSTFFNKGSVSGVKTDIVMKNYLDKLKINRKNELYVFHLIGSHNFYFNRYLKKHSLYTEPKTIIEVYDNTIYFTDFIIKNIITFFKKLNQKILIIYLSDHGEVINVKKHGHGYYPSYKDEYEIPFLIYSSIDNKRIDELFKKNKKHYFNVENFNYLLKYISGVSNDLNISYSSIVFSVDPKNILNYEKINFFK